MTVATDAPIFIVMNAGSGKHAGEDVRLVIERTLTNSGRAFTLHEVDDPARLKAVAAEVVERARGRRGIVIAAGGDGTINAVAEATLGSGCPFGVLPLGTFNYFSRVHGIPSDVQTACDVLLTYLEFEVQVGLVNDKVFLVNGAIGIYPELLEEREEPKRNLGAAAGWQSVPHLPRYFVRIACFASTSRRAKPNQHRPGDGLRRQQSASARASRHPHAELEERHRLVGVVLRPVTAWQPLSSARCSVNSATRPVVSFALERMTVRSRFARAA